MDLNKTRSFFCWRIFIYCLSNHINFGNICLCKLNRLALRLPFSLLLSLVKILHACNYFFPFSKWRLRPPGLCIKEMHTIFIYIFFNKDLLWTYITQSEAITNQLQTWQWVKNMTLGPHDLKTQTNALPVISRGIAESPYDEAGGHIWSSQPPASISRTCFKRCHRHQPLVWEHRSA
jgi:hypothetical protein